MPNEKINPFIVKRAIEFARLNFPNDGAEGETVHLLCDALEREMAENEELKARVVEARGLVNRLWVAWQLPELVAPEQRDFLEQNARDCIVIWGE